MQNIENSYELFLKKTPLIDVRAPVEFAEGSLPNAVNLPLLNNDERAMVGTIYKKKGQAAAIALGNELVSGEIKKARIQAWIDFIVKNPNAVIYCFRGGLRSQTTQSWLKDCGIERPLVKGGYKKARQGLLQIAQEVSAQIPLMALTGSTGAGKTTFLHKIKNQYPCVDLESIAQHRGSAFGGTRHPQPTQINFENELALALLSYQNKIVSQNSVDAPLLVEDESRMIGQCVLPEILFKRLKLSPIVWLDVPIEERVENILQEYIIDSPITAGCCEVAVQHFDKLKSATQLISRRLGGLRTQEVLQEIESSKQDYLQKQSFDSNRSWIEKLLLYYYDPSYAKALEKRDSLVVFKGSAEDCRQFLASQKRL